MRSYSFNSDHSHFLGSVNSLTETNSSVPGPGRLVGKSYGFVGRKIEAYASSIASRVGFGPRSAATKIRLIRRKIIPLEQNNKRELEKAGKRLIKYIR